VNAHEVQARVRAAKSTRRLGRFKICPSLAYLSPFCFKGVVSNSVFVSPEEQSPKRVIFMSCLPDRRQWCAIAVLFAVLLVVLILFLVL
jgi:hypothetical protein